MATAQPSTPVTPHHPPLQKGCPPAFPSPRPPKEPPEPVRPCPSHWELGIMSHTTSQDPTAQRGLSLKLIPGQPSKAGREPGRGYVRGGGGDFYSLPPLFPVDTGRVSLHTSSLPCPLLLGARQGCQQPSLPQGPGAQTPPLPTDLPFSEGAALSPLRPAPSVTFLPPWMKWGFRPREQSLLQGSSVREIWGWTGPPSLPPRSP